LKQQIQIKKIHAFHTLYRSKSEILMLDVTKKVTVLCCIFYVAVKFDFILKDVILGRSCIIGQGKSFCRTYIFRMWMGTVSYIGGCFVREALKYFSRVSLNIFR
jgi:hypothetical protein